MATGNDRVLVRNSAARNRAAKAKVFLCVILLSAGASFGWTPTVPDTILLPDSLGPLRPGYHLAFGSSTNNIYVASESSDIMVVDGETFQRIKRIYTGTPVGGALLVSQHNKLYCSYPQQGRIGVIDCATNDMVGSIQVGTRPTLLCYSSVSDKLYCGDTIDRTVSVIDCAADTVCRVISVGRSLSAMVYDPTSDKVYAATRDALLAISCSADSVVASIDEIKSSRGLCVHKRRRKLYVVGRAVESPDSMYVLSTQSDSMIAEMPCGWDLVPRLACNEATDRLYLAVRDGEYLYEFDCAGDTYVRYGYTPGYQGNAIACDTVHNRLFHLSKYNLLVLDCVTLNAVAKIAVEGDWPQASVLELDPARYRVVYAGWSGSYGQGMLTVFDYKHDTTYAIGAVPLCGWTHAMYHNPATDRLYVSGGRSLGVIDEHTNRVVSRVFLPDGGRGMTYSRTSSKFYFQHGYGSFREKNGLGVMDGSNDSLLGTIGIGNGYASAFPCWSPDGNKIYCFAQADLRYYIAVIDCYTDSVVRTIDVYGLIRWFEYLGNGRILCNATTSLLLFDCTTDSILADSAITEPAYRAVHTGDGEKVYIIRPGRLDVRSSSSLSLLGTIAWAPGGIGSFLVYSDTTQKLYWFVRNDSALAIDATRDTVTARIATGYASLGMAWLDYTGKYLFFQTYADSSSSLRVYDSRTDSLLGVYAPLPSPLCITSNPDKGCIYVGRGDEILVYPDVPPGVEETSSAEVRVTNCGPTVVSGMLFLSGDRRPGTGDRAALLDIAGRVVMNLQPGANNVSHLGVGVYFVRSQPSAVSRLPSVVTKVVVAK
jgi:DNA-binding beta-propeller fold protein YncE